MQPDLSIIIPTYNDAGSIENVVREAAFVAKKTFSSYEIVVVNDGSTDTTGEILDKLSTEIAGLRTIQHDVNRGFGYTIRELYESAAGNLVFSIPGDGQIRATQLERMLPVALNADVVVGWREIRNDSSRRKGQSYVYNSLIRFLYRVRIGDVNSAKLIRRRVLDKVTPLESQSPFVDAELCIKALRRGMTIKGVVIDHTPRQYGIGGGGNWLIIWETFRDMLLMWPRLRPRGEGPVGLSEGGGLRGGNAGASRPPDDSSERPEAR